MPRRVVLSETIRDRLRLTAGALEHRQRVKRINEFEPLVTQDHFTGENDAARMVDLTGRGGSAVVNRDDAAWGNERRPCIPIVSKAVVRMIAIKENEIHRPAIARSVGSSGFGAGLPHPSSSSVAFRGHLAQRNQT